MKKSLERPRISPNAKSKVSSGVRQLKLDMIIEECLKLYPDEKDAYTRVSVSFLKVWCYAMLLSMSINPINWSSVRLLITEKSF